MPFTNNGKYANQKLFHFSRKRLQLLFCQPVDGPFIHRFDTDAFVKVDGGLVPIETDPFHAAAVTLQGQFGQMLQQRFAVTETAFLWQHEEIFQIKAFSSHKSGEIMEKEGEADDFAIFLPKHYFRFVAHKESLVQALHGGFHFMGKFFILGQFLDKFQNSGGFVLLCRANGECGRNGLFLCFLQHCHGMICVLSSLQYTSTAIIANGGRMHSEMPNHAVKEWFRCLAKNPLNSAHPK